MDAIEDRTDEEGQHQMECGVSTAEQADGETEEGASAEERLRDAYRLW